MQEEFGRNPDLHMLFSRYWELYIKKLPEAIFSQVNENFYRTTFYSFYSQILFSWFTWNIERSYPQGRTDLEFVGKYHERFSGLRWVIEFKYSSNTEWKKLKTPIESFNLQEQDRSPILAYVGNLKQEYPQARIHLFIVYCIGNTGFEYLKLQSNNHKDNLKKTPNSRDIRNYLNTITIYPISINLAAFSPERYRVCSWNGVGSVFGAFKMLCQSH